MAIPKVFVSFDWDNDKHYKFLLEAWDANSDFDFSFSDNTPTEIQSTDISRIKAAITTKINKSDYTLVIVGSEANKKHSDSEEIGFTNWINFEVNRSIDVTKLRAVKIESSYSIPLELSGQDYIVRTGFSEENVLELLD